MDGRDNNYNVIPVARELVSALERGVVASASAIYDYDKNKSQETINAEVNTAISAAVESWNTTYTEDIKPQLESAIATANIAELKADDLNGTIEGINTALSGKASVASVEELTAEIADLLSNNVTVSCIVPSNKRYFYKGYPIDSITVSSSVQNAKASDITNYAIFKGNERIGDAQSGVTSLSRTVTNISQNTQFRATLSLTTNNGVKQKQSSTVSVTGINPIYYGVQTISSFESFNALNFASEKCTTSALLGYVNGTITPVTTTDFENSTIGFTMVSNQRAWIVTSVATLKGNDGGFEFPFYRYSINLNNIDCFLYISKGVYTDGKHNIKFTFDGVY